jgi:hypothetical protein
MSTTATPSPAPTPAHESFWKRAAHDLKEIPLEIDNFLTKHAGELKAVGSAAVLAVGTLDPPLAAAAAAANVLSETLIGKATALFQTAGSAAAANGRNFTLDEQTIQQIEAFIKAAETAKPGMTATGAAMAAVNTGFVQPLPTTAAK